jgi:hypothetical protein
MKAWKWDFMKTGCWRSWEEVKRERERDWIGLDWIGLDFGIVNDLVFG